MAVNKHSERLQPRYSMHKHVHYVYDLDYGFTNGSVFQGITVDASSAGMCLYVYQALMIGDRLKISTDMHSKPQQPAIVRWVQKISVDVFKAGLLFDQDR